MPTYVYETIPGAKKKARRFEVYQSIKDDPLSTDPETGDPVKRVISGGMEIPRGSSSSATDRPAAPSCVHSGGCGCR
ncbi:MAG: zinc ribbon domain-containing protein [Verrucomicrobia bacterium]|nr:zinc ribbon domain-containing protein [Verrucomicrobiota bacterium]MDA1088422.1 zinc ribbon domain-containing protein [Verrucomicrobiota bacterium]